MQHISIVIQIFIGSFVVLTSFLGCFGLCRESLGLTWSVSMHMTLINVNLFYFVQLFYHEVIYFQIFKLFQRD